jgi:uncharacterized protein (AIM24 family)
MTNPPAVPPRSYTCPWCGTASLGATLSCPACGAPLDARLIATPTGWYELPPIKDMAKLQFGQSFCQIEGTYVPVADMNLAAGDSVYFTHHVLLWKDSAVQVTTLPLSGAWKRLFAGLPLIMTQAHGPGHIAFSRDAPGELVAVPLQPGQVVDVREHLFLVASGSVTYNWARTTLWYTVEKETHYPLGMYMDTFSAPQTPGLLLLHGGGNVFLRHLAAGETVLVKPRSLLFKDASVRLQMHIETWRSPGLFAALHSGLWLRVHGPGRLAIQSAFEKLPEPGYNSMRWNWGMRMPLTRHDW